MSYQGILLDTKYYALLISILQKLTAGNTVYIRNNSGGSSDCVEETQWRYGRLAVYMVAPE